MGDWGCPPWFPEGHGVQGLRAHCGGWMWDTPGAVLASIRAPTLQGTRGVLGRSPCFWVRALQVLGQWVSALWVGCGGIQALQQVLAV